MLSKEKILQLIETLHETIAARDILVPLLRKMGLKGAKYTGGTGEEGIDAEYYELTEPEKRRSYVGLQMKIGPLTYSARGTKGSVKAVLNQAEEAFEKEIYDIDNRTVVNIARCIIVATGEINETARKYIGKAQRLQKDRGIDYWDGDRLAEFIQKHFMDEFEAYFKDAINALPDEAADEPVVIDANYIEENYDDEVARCLKVKATLNTWDWTVARALIALSVNSDSSWVELPDLLIELEVTDESIQEELGHLRHLGYLEVEGNALQLDGRASCFYALADIIAREIFEAKEDTEPMQIFDQLVK